MGGAKPPYFKISFIRLFFFSSELMNSTRCSTVSTASPATPIVTLAGLRRYFLASRSTAGGIVAEKRVVTRCIDESPSCVIDSS